MSNNDTEKTPIAASKSFLTVGPTLHYSHANVQSCWFLALAAFITSCCFWSKISTGSFWGVDFEVLVHPSLWRPVESTLSGISIFEYPWQILVLGLVMGILAIAPILVAQLLSFSYSLPFILSVAFLANLPGLAVSLFLSCFAVVCRPLRFRSRFIAIWLCTAPQLLYWGLFCGASGVEPIKWGFSFTPWICAWLTALGVAGLVLGIGHFTRYRPGLVWIFSSTTLILAMIVFQGKIGFDELDYQLYVAKNNPEQAREFHAHSITQTLDEQITNQSPALKRHIRNFFYPTEPIPLRAALKGDILNQLRHDRWPSWFSARLELQYQAKKDWLIEQYDLFITRRPESRRMPIALYYKALLSEYSPDISILDEQEVLSFYSDYPYERSQELWYWLYDAFGESAESLEARWRIAKEWARRGKFELANNLLEEALVRVCSRLGMPEKDLPKTETLFSPFRPPAESAITRSKLEELQVKLKQLQSLISESNRTNDAESGNRLAEFIMLNPHASDYGQRLNRLLEQSSESDPLRDNILLAQTKLIADKQLQAEKLGELHKQFQDTDGGMQALYKLGVLKHSLWSQQEESNAEQKKKYLIQAREIFTEFTKFYPDSFYSEQVKKNLDNLPTVD